MAATYGFKITAVPPIREQYKAAVKANAKVKLEKRAALKRLGSHFVDLSGQEARGGSEGSIAKGIFYRTFDKGADTELRVYPGKIGLWHLYGTGLYGPKKRYIEPVHAKAMRWTQNGEVVYAYRTKGIKPDKFFGRAYRRWLPRARKELREVAFTWRREIAGTPAKALNL